MSIRVEDVVEMLFLAHQEEVAEKNISLDQEIQAAVTERDAGISELFALLHSEVVKQNPGIYQIAELISLVFKEKVVVVSSEEEGREKIHPSFGIHVDYWKSASTLEKLFVERRSNYLTDSEKPEPLVDTNPTEWFVLPLVAQVGLSFSDSDDEGDQSPQVGHWHLVNISDYFEENYRRKAWKHNTVVFETPPIELYDRIRTAHRCYIALQDQRKTFYGREEVQENARIRARLTAKVTQLLLEKAGVLSDFEDLVRNVFQSPILVEAEG